MTTARTLATTNAAAAVRRAFWKPLAEIAVAFALVLSGTAAILVSNGALTAQGFTAEPPRAPVVESDIALSEGALEVALVNVEPIGAGVELSNPVRVDAGDWVIVTKDPPPAPPLAPSRGYDYKPRYDPPAPSEVRMCNRMLPDCGW